MFANASKIMLNGYRLFTLTHRHATLDQLEPYVIADDAKESVLKHLRKQLGWEEVFYLNTCNRVLFFFYQEERNPTSAKELQAALGIAPDADALEPVYMEAEDAVLHLYDVAASVDSMVVGEREILRQLRLSYIECHGYGHCADHLRLVMQSAVAAAKQVYHETRIGQKPVSVVSLAAQRIRQQRLQPATARVLLVGAGQTNWLIAKFLRKQGYADVTVANRTLRKAEKLAATFTAGRAMPLNQLGTHPTGFDLLVVATGATEPVIDAALLARLIGNDDAQDKVVVDLSIPHNVAAEAIEKHQPHYIQIDDLRKLASDNLAFRASEVTEARKLIGKQLLAFRSAVQQRRIEKALSHLPEEINRVKKKAMDEVFRRELAELDDDTLKLIHRMMGYMEKKCIGVPMKAARSAVVT